MNFPRLSLFRSPSNALPVWLSSKKLVVLSALGLAIASTGQGQTLLLTTRNEGDLTTIAGWDFNGTTQSSASSMNARYNQQYANANGNPGGYFTAGTGPTPGSALYGTVYFNGSNGATFSSARNLSASGPTGSTAPSPNYDLLSTVGLIDSNNSLGDQSGATAANAKSFVLSNTTTLDNARAVFKISSANDFNTFEDLSVAFSARNAGSAFASIDWSYSLDGVTFTSMAGTSNQIDPSGTLYSVFNSNFSAFSALDGQSTLWLGLNYSENTAAASTFLDNVAIYGTSRVVPTQVWDGGDSNKFRNNAGDGGDGTWTASSTAATSWTGSIGANNKTWSSLTAVFGGTAGTVTVDPAGITFTGARFTTTGYTVNGGTLTTSTAGTALEAGSGISATLASVIAGTGGIDKLGTGSVTLTAANTYTGATTVSAGTLTVNGSTSAASAVTVANGGTLAGTGTLGGAVTVQNGGTLAGSSGQTLTLGSLALGASSSLNVALGAPSSTRLFQVNGALTLDGTLNITDAGGFAQGVYRLFDFTGALTDNGLSIGASPVSGGLTVQTSVASQINLVYNASNKNFWKGGTGTWDTATASWTDAAASAYAAWQPDFAIFQGTGGTVTVDNTSGTVRFTGAQFASTGYIVTGATLTNNTANAGLSVGDGSANDAAKTATISAAIAGTGDIEKQGAGTLILSGANTYAGTTAVNAGILRINGNQSAATGAVTVASGATLTGTGTTGGAVTVQNGGILAGASGQTFTMAGLALTSGSNLNLSLGAPSTSGLFQVNGNLTLDGTVNIADLGSFGAGLYRIFNYTGTLTDNGLLFGTLPAGTVTANLTVRTATAGQVSLLYRDTTTPLPMWKGGGGIWSVDTAYANWGNGSLTDSWRPGNAVFDGTAGTVTVDTAAGAVVITGAQFASNGYTVTGGALTTNTADTAIRVGDGTSAGSAMTATLASVITGNGGINKTDLGTLILTGANTHTGGTTVTAGVLQINANTALGGNSNALTLNGGTLRFGAAGFNAARAMTLGANGGSLDTGAFDTTVNGVISGAGTLRKTGAGLLTLGGVNTFTGATTIEQGGIHLAAGSSLAATTVLAGARLSGTATIRGHLVNNGLLSPGNSPGTVTITGNYTQGATGTYNVEIASATSYDRVNATGTATLDGTLAITALNNFVPLPGQVFTILHADGGITGQFATVTSPFGNVSPMLRFQAAYGVNDVTLRLAQIPFAEVGASTDGIAIGAGLDAAIALGKLPALQAALNAQPSQADVSAALPQLSPLPLQRAYDQAVMAEHALVRSAEARLSRHAPANAGGLWSETISRETRYGGNADSPGTRAVTSGILVGADTAIDPDIQLGLLAAITDERLTIGNDGTATDITRFTAALYGRYDHTLASVEAAAGLTYAKLDNTRLIAIPGYARVATSAADSGDRFVSLRAARDFTWRGLHLEPFAAAQHLSWTADKMTEYGGDDASLVIREQNHDSTTTRLGLALAWPVKRAWLALTPRAELSWRREHQGGTRKIDAEIGGGSFRVRSKVSGMEALVGTLGLNAAVGTRFTAYAHYTTEQAEHIGSTHTMSAGVEVRF